MRKPTVKTITSIYEKWHEYLQVLPFSECIRCPYLDNQFHIGIQACAKTAKTISRVVDLEDIKDTADVLSSLLKDDIVCTLTEKELLFVRVFK